MAPLELLIAFAVATLLFAAFPGPAILYTAAQTMARGRRGGMLAVLGIHIGGYAHVLAAALGLSVLFKLVPVLYVALKFAGALYLVWVGIGLIRSASQEGGSTPPTIKSGPRVFAESVAVEVLNPKAALFYVAFLPQFIDPAAAFPVWLQFLILGTIVNITFGLADVVTVFATATIMGALRRASAAQRWLKRAGGAVMIGLGMRLALDRS